jgi:hypothetical protein
MTDGPGESHDVTGLAALAHVRGVGPGRAECDR